MFVAGEILIPKTDLKSWSVVACDQFTSDPAYWDEVERIACDGPSAFRVILPEARLTDDDSTAIDAINGTMRKYLKSGLFESFNGMVYCRRTLPSGLVRQGVVGLLDLEQYDYTPGASVPVRATEGTVLERIPPRVKIRENAAIELPHVMVLTDDPSATVIEPLDAQTSQLRKLYDFDLMMGGGHIEGWLLGVEQIKTVQTAIAALAEKSPMALAVGDGNHSLASARACYLKNPTELSRYAMVELCNLHDSSLVFEAIHRAVFEIEPQQLLAELRDYCAALRGNSPEQRFTVVTKEGDIAIEVPHPEQNLTVGTVQRFLDGYLAKQGGRVDYIHGEDEARALAGDSSIAILLPAMNKTELFPTVIQDGVLPRKTFSMGEACEKRYYLECRRIK